MLEPAATFAARGRPSGAYIETLAAEYRERALDELEQTGFRNEAQEHLRELAQFLAQRSY